MKIISLSTGQEVLVDDDVYQWASKYRWFAGGSRTHRYAARTIHLPGRKSTTLYLHRLILDPTGTLITDHINGNTFDCRRENLREATHSQNSQNITSRPRSSTGVRNVTYRPKLKQYKVQVQLNGQNRSYGHYQTLEEAAAVAAAVRRRIMSHAPDNTVSS